RKDGKGFIEILPGKDVAGQHGKSYRFLGIDEIHTQANWALLEALELDPHRPDAQRWITSYASVFHKPGIPLFDLLKLAREDTDPHLYCSWYSADWCSDPKSMELQTGEERANPSLATIGGMEYLQQQKLRLPGHIYRRLHLNLPGLPEGAAFSVEAIL